MHIPRGLAVFIISEVLEALDYAHNARDMEGKPMQIVHRDISPSNIFMSKRGDVKLGDFGIAHAQRRESKTQAGTLKGKYGYMSPEQVVGRPIDARSDLFAVGVLFAELLTGRRLFSAPADLDVLLKVRDVKLERLDKYGADLPPALDKIVRHALKKNPDERFPSAAAFRDELADYLFATGQRVRASDLRTFAAGLFGDDPDAAARMLQEARRMETAKLAKPAEAAAAARATAGPPAAPAAPPAAAAPAGRRRPRFGRPRRWCRDVVSDAPTAQTAPPTGGWPDDDSAERSSVRGFTPVSGPGEASIHTPTVRPNIAGRATTHSDVGRFVSAAPKRPPDSAGDVSIISPMRLFCDLALAGETGLLHFGLEDVQKEIFLVGGAPESVSSSNPSERFGEYLVGRKVLGPSDLDWRSACCLTTTASWATRWWRWACCARSTCSACCRSRSAIASSTCSCGPRGRSRSIAARPTGRRTSRSASTPSRSWAPAC